MELWTAVTLGLLGSLHCVGMCGPIAMLLPYQAESRSWTWFYMASYHLGRIASYALIGILPGLLGLSFLLAGYQKGLSISLGILLLLAAIFAWSLSGTWEKRLGLLRWQQWVQKRLGQLLGSQHRFRFFGVGMLNGFLPCGLVYVALAGAVGQPSVGGAMAYMALFGLGTVPLMMGASVLGNRLGRGMRPYLRRVYPWAMVLMGVLLLSRGLSIDLPFDLRFALETTFPQMCH